MGKKYIITNTPKGTYNVSNPIPVENFEVIDKNFSRVAAASISGLDYITFSLLLSDSTLFESEFFPAIETFVDNVNGNSFGIRDGYNATFGGGENVMFGHYNTILADAGYNNFLSGSAHQASGSANLFGGFGNLSEVGSYGNVIGGAYNIVRTTYSAIFGYNNKDRHPVGGGLPYPDGGNIITGFNNYIDDGMSIALFGSGHTQTGNNVLVGGQASINLNGQPRSVNSAGDARFIVGNGSIAANTYTRGTPSNAFVVYHSGLIVAPTLTPTLIDTQSRALITREYLTSAIGSTTPAPHNHDDRYFTETESDGRFFNVTGDDVVGDSSFTGKTTYDGNVWIDTNNGQQGLFITRYGETTGEYIKNYLEDIVANYYYQNDERHARFKWTINNTDTESNAGANANLHTFEFLGNEFGAYLYLDGQEIIHAGNISNYAAAEVNDLSNIVTWTIVPDLFISQSSVVQHEAALSITESQISDLQNYMLNWRLQVDGLNERLIANNSLLNITSGVNLDITVSGNDVLLEPNKKDIELRSPNTSSTIYYYDGLTTTTLYHFSRYNAATNFFEFGSNDGTGEVISARVDRGKTDWEFQGRVQILAAGRGLNLAGSSFVGDGNTVSNKYELITTDSGVLKLYSLVAGNALDQVVWSSDALGGNETDPIFSGSPSFGITNTDITNWDTAFGWGNHAGLYEPTFTKNTDFNKTLVAGTNITLDRVGSNVTINAATGAGADGNNYLSGVTGSGNGTVTFTRTGLSNLTWNAAHLHTGVYEPVFSKNTAFNKNFAGSGAATTVARSDHNHAGVYEPALGNPTVDGYVLSSTVAGVRTWVAASGGADGNNYPTALAFNTTTGIFTLSRNGLSDISVDLDGRYAHKKTTKVVSSTTYTLLSSDQFRWLVFTANCTVTVPTGLLVDDLFEGEADVSGQITFQAAGGVTLRHLSTLTKIVSSNGVFGIRFRANNNAILYGTDPI